MSPYTDATLSVFAIGDSIEVIRDAFSGIPGFVRYKRNHISYKVRGVKHYFNRFHPALVVDLIQTLWDDVPSHAGAEDCGQCVSEKSLFLAHADCWAIAEQCGISTAQLYQFAVQTQPLVPWQGAELHSRLLGLPNCSSFETQTPLTSLLHVISRRLPLELQQIIVDSLQWSAMDDTEVASRASGQDETVAESGGALFTQLAVVQSLTIAALKKIRTENGLNCHASRSSDAVMKGDLRGGLMITATRFEATSRGPLWTFSPPRRTSRLRCYGGRLTQGRITSCDHADKRWPLSDCPETKSRRLRRLDAGAPLPPGASALLTLLSIQAAMLASLRLAGLHPWFTGTQL